MSQKNETLTLILALLITAALLGGGFWWFTRKSGVDVSSISGDGSNNNPNEQPQTIPSSPPIDSSTAFPPPTNVPSGTTVSIEGSTSMVQINQALKNSFEQQFSGTTVDTQAGGTDNGIQSVLQGSADIAAISRPLTSEEKKQGLLALPVAKDTIAIVIGRENTFQRSLTKNQVVEIFTGKTTNWSELGGASEEIRVIKPPLFQWNPSGISGTSTQWSKFWQHTQYYYSPRGCYYTST